VTCCAAFNPIVDVDHTFLVEVCGIALKIARALVAACCTATRSRLTDLLMPAPLFATLLIVDDEIEAEARPTGPTRVRRLVRIADEISRIAVEI
jgi:hypothetical protein